MLPAPSRISSHCGCSATDALRHSVPTIVETFVGLGRLDRAAIAAAVAMDRFSVVRRAVEPLLVGSQTIPIVAIAPLIVLWFGFGLLPKSWWSCSSRSSRSRSRCWTASRRRPAEATDLMRSFGASSRQIFRKLRWPAALPALFTGLRSRRPTLSSPRSSREYVGAYEGLGIWMQLSQNAFRTDLVFAAILLTAVLSIGLYALVVAAERATIPWYRGVTRGAPAGTVLRSGVT